MSLLVLESFLPPMASEYIGTWFGDTICHIRITKERSSKLGDFRLLPDGTHQISINSTLEPELFFFVLTHEIAHLKTLSKNRNMAPHGKEWKACFREMLLKSLGVYSTELQPIIVLFSKNPKANFMASPELVKYFHKKEGGDLHLVEELNLGEQFIYNTEPYLIEERKKKRYLCRHLHSGKKYLFKSCARVMKMNP